MATDLKLSTPIVGPDAGSKEWLDIRLADPARERPVVFGATSAAPACGMSPYQTPLELYLRQLGRLPPVEVNDAMRWGSRLEDDVLEEYAERSDCDSIIADLPMYFHGEHNFMAATPDAIAVTKDGEEYGVECKTTTREMYDESGLSNSKFGPDGSDLVPVQYVLQVHQQMAVMGWNRVDIPVLFGNRDFKIYHVQRSDALIDHIVQHEMEMKNRILSHNAPGPDYAHKSTSILLQSMYPEANDETVDLSDFQDVYEYYVQTCMDLKNLDDQKRELQNQLLDHMGTANRATFGDDAGGLKRAVIKDSPVTDKHIDDLKAKQENGEPFRKGYVRLSITKPK